jgi:hypothetical protein
MTKFEEMCQARTQCARIWNEYRERSYENLMKLAVGFIAHCQIPQDCASFVPLEKEPEQGVVYTPTGAIHFDTTEQYWRLGLIITLRESENIWPQSRVRLEIALREQAGKIIVKRGRDDSPREIDPSDQEQCKEFYDSIAERVRQFFAVGPENLADGSLRTIGFAAG